MNIDYFVDSATIDELLTLFQKGSIENSFGWNYQSAVNLTALLINRNNRLLVPPATNTSAIGNKQGEFFSKFKEFTVLIQNNKQEKHTNLIKVAKSNSKKWITSKKEELKTKIDDLVTFPDYKRWIESEKSSAWNEFVDVYQALFNIEYIKALSHINNVSENELKKLCLRTNTKFWSREFDNNTQEFIGKLYFDCVVLRGIFHQYLNKAFENTLVQHPIRSEFVLNKSQEAKSLNLVVGNSIHFVCNIIVNDSLLEKKYSKRLERYFKHISNFRAKINPADHRLNSEYSQDAAIDNAIQLINNSSHLKLKRRIIEHVTDAMPILPGVLNYIQLLPFEIPTELFTLGLVNYGIKTVTTKSGGKMLSNLYSDKNLKKKALMMPKGIAKPIYK